MPKSICYVDVDIFFLFFVLPTSVYNLKQTHFRCLKAFTATTNGYINRKRSLFLYDFKNNLFVFSVTNYGYKMLIEDPKPTVSRQYRTHIIKFPGNKHTTLTIIVFIYTFFVHTGARQYQKVKLTYIRHN